VRITITPNDVQHAATNMRVLIRCGDGDLGSLGQQDDGYDRPGPRGSVHDKLGPPQDTHARGNVPACGLEQMGIQTEHIRPDHPGQPPSDCPVDWIEEHAHDGSLCYRNVRTSEMSWNPPGCWAGIRNKPVRVWTAYHDRTGVYFEHRETGEVVRPRRAKLQQSERLRKDRQKREQEEGYGGNLVPIEQTRLGKRVMRYSAHELRLRDGHHGSSRSVLDRKKYERDTVVCEAGDGTAILRLRRSGEKLCQMTVDELAVYQANPHMRQAFANQSPPVRVGSELTAAGRIADKQYLPRTPYARRQGEAKTVEHWGQRKLLMSEIEFLTLYGHLADLVVYAGAAPGTHTSYMSAELFPNHKWLLVDPAPFDAQPSGLIDVRQTYFTDELARELKGNNLLFICDIRSMDVHDNESQKESRVAADMECQRRWVQIMRPKASMLKFRLPYVDPGEESATSEYLDGDMFMPVWGGRTTTETRLVVTDAVRLCRMLCLAGA